jgi:nucleoside-diphosphate-sugar epimerase/CBS domain-containing protein
MSPLKNNNDSEKRFPAGGAMPEIPAHFTGKKSPRQKAPRAKSPYFIVKDSLPIKSALAAIDRKQINFGIILGAGKTVRGVFTAGDLRRAILAGKSIDAPVILAANTNPVTAPAGTGASDLRVLAAAKGIGSSPIILLDETGAFAGVHVAPPPRRRRLTKDIKLISVRPSETIRGAMAAIDRSGLGIALVTDGDMKFIGLATDRDLRSAVICGSSLGDPVSTVMNTSPVTGAYDMGEAELRNLNSTGKNIKIPLLDSAGRVRDLVTVYAEPSSKGRIMSIGQMKSAEGRRLKRILVTGGAGYLGSILTGALLDRGYRVRVLDALYFGDAGLKPFQGRAGFEFVKGDVRHIEDVTRSMQDADAVIHLAGIVGDPACAKNPLGTAEQNYLATAMLAQVAKHHQVNRFIFASSCSVYGASERVVTENSRLNPLSLYAKDKIYSERVILSMADGNFSPTIFRMGTLFGLSERMRFDLVINLLCAKAVYEREFKVFGGSQWRPFVHVSDAADAYIRALESPIEKVRKKIFNLGSDAGNVRILDIGRMVHKAVPESKMLVEETQGDKRNYRVSFGKIRRELGFTAKVGVEQGIREIASALSKGRFSSYKEPQYSNYLFITQ